MPRRPGPTRGRRRLLVAAVAVGAAVLVACGPTPTSEPRFVRITGSDTMLTLARRWAEAFMRLHPGIVVHVEGGGTGAGVVALVDGRADLGTGSRPLLPSEVQRLNEKHASLGVSFRCARDGVSVYLNPANPVHDIDLPRLKELFAGRIANWREVGGPDARVHILRRPPNSGTHQLFRELVLDEEDYAPDAVILPTTAAVVDAVRHDTGAAGYGGLAFAPDLVHCAVGGRPPTPANVRNGSYPLARYLFLHAVRQPRGWPRRFVDFVFSDEGQRIVEEVGFVSLWETTPADPG
ncbi:MAG: phosphate ABC transporter substrate-binding protein [Acidobacteria bacterium]|nr:phosphate ABC transporter substrate-binding protein [Acidobacteriota bacterium]